LIGVPFKMFTLMSKGYDAASVAVGTTANMITKSGDFFQSKIRPKIQEVVKFVANNMTDIWNNLGKFKQRYDELEVKIAALMKFGNTSMSEIPGGQLNLKFHNFAPGVLKEYMNVCSNYVKYTDFVKSLFGEDNWIEPKTFYDVAKEGVSSYDKLMVLANKFGTGCTNLNKDGMGPKSIILDLWNNAFGEVWKAAAGTNAEGIPVFNGVFKAMWNRENLTGTIKDANMSASSWVKLSILRDEVQRQYTDAATFRKEMCTPHDGYLAYVGAILNNNHISTMLEDAGKTMKEEFDRDKENTDDLMKMVKEIIQNEKTQLEAQYKDLQQQNNANKVNQSTQNNETSTGTGSQTTPQMATASFNELEFAREFLFQNEKISLEEDSPVTAVNGDQSNGKQQTEESLKEDLVKLGLFQDTVLFYENAYGKFLLDTSTCYQAIVRGCMSALHMIITETEAIEGAITNSTTKAAQ